MLAVAVGLGTCATRPSGTGAALPFDQAVRLAVDDLLVQTQKLPAFLSRVEARLKLGTGADDASDALDRRVEFKTAVCDASA